jgi:hypothetical protein
VEKVYDKDQRLTLETLKEISHSLDDVIELLVNTPAVYW